MLQMVSNETCDSRLLNVTPRNSNKLPCLRCSAVWTCRAEAVRGQSPGCPRVRTSGRPVLDNREMSPAGLGQREKR